MYAGRVLNSGRYYAELPEVATPAASNLDLLLAALTAPRLFGDDAAASGLPGLPLLVDV